MARTRVSRRPGAALGLRGRLALFFVAIVLLPLVVALLAWTAQLRKERAVAAERAVEQAAQLSTDLLTASAEALGVLVDLLATGETAAALDEGDTRTLEERLGQALDAAPAVADVLVAVDPDGAVVTALGREPETTSEDFADVEEIAAGAALGRGVPGAVVAARELTANGRTIGFVAAARWLDSQTLGELPAPPGGGVAAIVGDRVVAGSEPAVLREVPPADDGEDGAQRVATDGADVVVAAVGGDLSGARLLVWGPAADLPGAPGVFAAVLLPAALVAGLAGWLLAGTVVAPIGRAAAAARAVAAGHLDRRLPTGESAGELEDLSVAFNAMSRQLQSRVAELERSRDELRGSLSRLGETLSSSLDLDRTLAVVAEMAMDTLAADRALLMLFTPERDALYAKVGRGMAGTVPRLRPGQGRLGHVAVAGTALLVRAGEGTAPAPAPDEPSSSRQLLVPLVGRGETLGVLSLLRADDAVDFGEDDLETLQSFAAQAAVAVENVFLHEEAQRRSLTDPLTGLWNFRHFSTQAERELESAARFDRPLSLLVVDIDHFKNVNDEYGHQAGDAVLREIAARIRDSARAPDLIARYGGEEFVALLPGTDAGGALTSAERIRHRVSATPYRVDSSPRGDGGRVTVDVTCSIGVAAYPDHATRIPELLRRADEALYAAKSAGRDRVILWGNDRTSPARS